MATKVIIPTALRPYAGKQASVELEAGTIGELLDKLTGQYQDLRKHLYNDEGKLRSFVNVYVNEEDVRYLQQEQTPLKASDVVSIVPSIAGGSPGGVVVGDPLTPALSLGERGFQRT